MNLSVLERLRLLNLLPAKGDITTVRIMRVLREDLSFSEDEHKELNFVSDEEGLHWDPEVFIDKEVEIGDAASAAIVREMDALDKGGEFPDELLDLYDRFVKCERLT